MRANPFEANPSLRIKPQHSRQQILHRRHLKDGTLSMLSPKPLRIPFGHRSVPFIPRRRLGKGRIPREQNEQNHARAENVTFLTVTFLQNQFGRAIALRADIGRFHAMFGVARRDFAESEVGDFEVIFGVEKEVLRFQIAVNDVRAMARR